MLSKKSIATGITVFLFFYAIFSLTSVLAQDAKDIPAEVSGVVQDVTQIGKDAIENASEIKLDDLKPTTILGRLKNWFAGIYSWIDNWVKKLTSFSLTEILRTVANFFIWLFTLLLKFFKWLLSILPGV